MSRLRDMAGVLVRDVGRYRRALAHSGSHRRSDPRGWISLCNRIERLQFEEGVPGVLCDWTWGSALHAPGVLPSLARSLMRASLEEWPIAFANRPRQVSSEPKLSFIFAHAGPERLPQLKRTIRSVFAQVDVPCEVVVVDQSPTPLLEALPTGVSYRHLAKPAGAPWHKTWAYNIGAKLARAPILVFHDGDICVPALYAQELLSVIDGKRYRAASLQRFLYYLDGDDSASVERLDSLSPSLTPEMVFQNWKGGTIAIDRDAFEEIGGFDESFKGWGGEDFEFFDRCAEVGHCRAGYLPFVHLWHAAQPSKSGRERDENVAHFRAKMEVPRQLRIEKLRQGR